MLGLAVLAPGPRLTAMGRYKVFPFQAELEDLERQHARGDL